MGRAMMTETVIKVRNGRMLRLPNWVVTGFGMSNGGFIRVRKTHAGILLKPAKPVDADQAYFWTKRWQRMEQEVDAEIRKGRIRRSRNIKELLQDLRS
jgi:hypothetical protein